MESVEVFTLTNAKGLRMRVMTCGASVLSLEVPDRQGVLADVVLGHRDVAGYIADPCFHGAVAGRYANRIADAQFDLDGVRHRLVANNNPAGIPCALHGGIKGYDKVVWKAVGCEREDAQGVCFSHLSPDGDEGYPGNLAIHITYWLTNDNEWTNREIALRGLWVDNGWTIISDPEIVDTVDDEALLRLSNKLNSEVQTFIIQTTSGSFGFAKYDKIKQRHFFLV